MYGNYGDGHVTESHDRHRFSMAKIPIKFTLIEVVYYYLGPIKE